MPTPVNIVGHLSEDRVFWFVQTFPRSPIPETLPSDYPPQRMFTCHFLVKRLGLGVIELTTRVNKRRSARERSPALTASSHTAARPGTLATLSLSRRGHLHLAAATAFAWRGRFAGRPGNPRRAEPAGRQRRMIRFRHRRCCLSNASGRVVWT